MTSTAAPPESETAERKDLRAILDKLADVGSVELKMNVPPEQRMALRNLRMDPLKGRLREVVFFDTPDLALFGAGLAVRGRRTQGKDDDTVAKVRPCMPNELPPAVRDSPNLKVELDVTRRTHMVSASLKGTRPAGDLTKVLAGTTPLEKFLSKEQRSFMADRLPAGVSWGDLVPLGPIYVIVVKSQPEGFGYRMTGEVWNFPGQIPLVELSTKSAPAEVFALAKETTKFLEGLGLTPTGEQEPKTRKALQFFAANLKQTAELPEVSGRMIVALAVLVGFAIATALVLLAARLVTRRDLARSDGVFHCRARVETGTVPGHGRRYGRRWVLGGWTHDVLLLRRTWAIPRLVPYPVGSADQLAPVADRPELMSLRLHLDGGAVVRVMADRTARTLLVGPFLMTEIERLDTGLMRGQA